VLDQELRDGPTLGRAQNLLRFTSLSMSRFRAYSATIFFNREFLTSSTFNRLASSTFMPPYWLRYR
jgi:hypothetical protein